MSLRSYRNSRGFWPQSCSRYSPPKRHTGAVVCVSEVRSVRESRPGNPWEGSSGLPRSSGVARLLR
jgi:hypothetical protein